MQWMTKTSVVPCHALHAPQHAAASPFGPLNHSNDFFRPSCRGRLYITGTGKSRDAGFRLELPTPWWIAQQGLRAPSNLDIATQIITKTCLHNFDPLKPHFYIVKLGFTGVYIIFLISSQKHRLWYSLEPPRRGGSNEYRQSMFWAEL